MLQPTLKRSEAWNDPDDANVKVNLSTKARLKKLKKDDKETEITGDEYQKRLAIFYNETLNKTQFFSWAKDETKFETSNLRSALNNSNIFEKSSSQSALDENYLEIKKIAKVNAHNSVVQSIDFHPNLNMMITCGYDKIANIFRIYEPRNYEEGKETPPKSIKKIYTERFPLTQGNFINEKEVLFCGKGRQLLNMELETGVVEEIASILWMDKMGANTKSFSFSDSSIAVLGERPYLAILDSKTKQFFSEIILPERCSGSFINENSVHVSGSSGFMYVYDIRNSGLVTKMRPEGCGENPVISSNSRYFAAGGNNGIVNVFRSDDNTKVKEIQNLTTAITSMDIGKDIMLINSKWKPNSARIVNLKNMNIFKNWPAQKTRLSSISSCKVCTHSNYIAYGNEEGGVTLYYYKI